jgi:hypothetical protein
MPLKDDKTTIRYDRGTPILYELADRIGVTVSTQVYGSHIYFHTIVRNFRENAIHAEDTSVFLQEHNAEGNENPKVYRAEEYYQQRRGQIIAGQVLMAVSAALSTANAGYSTSRTSGYYSAYGQSRNRYYRGYGYYSATTYTYDSAKAAMERDIAFSNVRDYVNGTNQELDYLRNTLFYPSDIDSGAEYYGIIVADFGATSNSTLKLSMEIEGVPFLFTFQKEQINYGD